MDAEDLALNNGSNSKIVENFGAIFPWVCVSVLSNCFIIKSINSCDLSSFVVSSEKGDIRWVFEF